MSAPLSEPHKIMLEGESGISPDVIAARGYQTVTTKAELERLGFSPKQRNTPALVLPIHSPTGSLKLYQARADTPRLDDKSKPVKYETPAGSSMALDMHPFAKAKAGDPSTPLFITEGIKKGDALVSRGLCTVALIGVWNWRGTNEHGGKMALPEWENVALNGRRVYIVFDSDVMTKKEVHAALVRLKKFLEHRGAKVKLIYLPTGDDEAKTGVDDYLAAGHSTDDLLALATSELKSAPRPEIQVNNRFLRDISDDAVAALEASNDPPTYFLRGTVPVRVATDSKAEVLTNTSLKGDLDRRANFIKVIYKEGAPEKLPARPPSDLAPDILTRPALPLPKLEAIANAPVVLPSGEILLEDGFDLESGILLRLNRLSNLCTDMPSAEALALLREVFADFPFVEAAGYAHALAMTLQGFVRPLIQGPVPIYLIDAPARGTGKGLLSEVSSLITLGYPAPVMSQPRDGDELEKRITTVLLEGRQIVFLDNVTRLDSPHLAAALTAEIWQGRILGKSELVTVPNRATWLATGNNVEISDELARRIAPIRLDAGVERPEERKGFRHADLPGWVKEHRSELVSACLSLIQNWLDAGRPRGTATLGRYESWAGVMGGILEVSGVQGFLSGRERLYAEADKETTEWSSFCEAWWSTFGERAVTASELFEIAKDRKLLLDLWGGRDGLSASQRFGRGLTSRRDRVFGGFKLRNAGKDSATKSNAYRLERTPNRTPETPLDPVNPVTDVQTTPGFLRGSETVTPETPQEPRENPVTSNVVQHEFSEPSAMVYGVSGVPNQTQTSGTPPEVRELHRRYRAGEFKGVALKIPGGTIPDLARGLEGYFSKKKLTDTERDDLLGIAQAVVGSHEPGLL